MLKILAVASIIALSGCSVYDADSGVITTFDPVVVAPSPVYVAPCCYGPVYRPAPVYRAPVYRAPAPVYRAPAPVYHR